MKPHRQDVNDLHVCAYQALIDSPVGKLGIGITHNHVTHINYVHDNIPAFTNNDPLTLRVIEQLNAYFADASFQFNLPIALDVSPFQQKVLRQLQRIPRGETRTYSDIANAIQSSPRPVGNACRHNPISIIIPCHRVVAVNSMGGYNGQTQGNMMNVKQWLLQHESK